MCRKKVICLTVPVEQILVLMALKTLNCVSPGRNICSARNELIAVYGNWAVIAVITTAFQLNPI
jgi:hypothetical protein